MNDVMTAEQQKLVEDNTKLVYLTISKHFPTYIGDEDIISCGFLGLCNAALKYDETKGAFSTLACKAIRNEIGYEFRKRNTQKRDAQVVSLDTPIDEDGNTLEDVIESDDGIEIIDINTDKFIQMLTDEEREVFNLKVSGYKIKDIERITGYDHKKMRSILRYIKRKYLKTH